MKSKLILALIFIALLAFTSNKFYTQQEQQKEIAFVDDFNENSSLEPDYYLYFKNISDDSLLGNYIYKRYNVDLELKDKTSTEEINLDKADIVVFILGTANTVINSLDTFNEVSPEDFRTKYITLIDNLIDNDKKVVIISPPPYKTISKYEDEAIINNRNALANLSDASENLVYVDLYTDLYEKYGTEKILNKELSEIIVKLILKKDSDILQN